jgi:hypothetical protein
MNFLQPQPDEVGIAQTKALYLRKYKRVLSETEAGEILGKVMRYMFLVNYSCLDMESTPENQTTIHQ